MQLTYASQERTILSWGQAELPGQASYLVIKLV